jgi:FtsP/CotA-like multicopper oxidase with cupredoxin domain
MEETHTPDEDALRASWSRRRCLRGSADGMPFITQPPIKPRETFVYEFNAKPAGSHMYHPHHNATDQVGRGMLGAFLVDPLGTAAYTCDTLGVNPGERFDVIIEANNPGAWAFHCHILAHAEGAKGMFGMVNALIVQA